MGLFNQYKTLPFIILAFVIGAFMLMTQGGAIWDWLSASTSSAIMSNLALVAFGIVGVIFSFWRTKIADNQEEAAQNVKITDSNSAKHIFHQAIEQLGATHGAGQPNREVRVGAMYALEKLSQANEEYTQVIMSLLSTYIRENAPQNTEKTTQEPIATDIQAAIAVIGRSQQNGKTIAINLSNSDLTEAHLTKANLTKANLTKASLIKASLWRAKLIEAYLNNADLTKADLIAADLSNAILNDANLTKAVLLDADLSMVILNDAILTEAVLFGSNLRLVKFKGAQLTKAILIDTNLRGADLTNADLTKADLTKADLTEAVLWDTDLTAADLNGAIVSTAQLAHAKNLHLAKNVDKIVTPEAADSSDTTAPPAK